MGAGCSTDQNGAGNILMDDIEQYSRSHIRELRYLAVIHELSAPDGFWTESEEWLTELYNGIGPEAWSGRFRRLTTWLLSFFEADALIHDYEYSLPEKGYWKFTLANVRFAWNACVLAFGSYSFRRACRVAVLGVFLALLCQIFGYGGYKAGAIPGKVKKVKNEQSDDDFRACGGGDSDRVQYGWQECREVRIREEPDS